MVTSRVPDPRVLRAINPFVSAILRSPLHRVLSGQVCLLTCTGRWSGQRYTVPLGYTRDGDTLLVVSQHSERKRWWRNLRGGASVALDLQGRRIAGRAEVLEEPAAVLAEVERLIARLGAREASARLYLGLDMTPPPTREQLAQALEGVVVIRVTPDTAAEPAAASEARPGPDAARKILVGCGLLSSVLYLAADVLAAALPGLQPRVPGVQPTAGHGGADAAPHGCACGHSVERPKRRTRRHSGKSDPIDAEAAARAVLAGTATGQPKAGNGPIEMIRSLQAVRRSALKARTQAANQLHALVITAPDALRTELRGSSLAQRVSRAAAFRASLPLTTPTAATKVALRSLARRYQQLCAEVDALEAQLARLVTQAAPELLPVKGVSTITAACLLVTAGDNPERLRCEAAFAHLCGVAPIPASSGKTTGHRLNRGGDREANKALYLLAVRRMGWDCATRAYVARRTGEGLSKLEIIRGLKRYLARELYPLLAANPLLAVKVEQS